MSLKTRSSSRSSSFKAVRSVIESLEGRRLLNGVATATLEYDAILANVAPHEASSSPQRDADISFNRTANKGVVAWATEIGTGDFDVLFRTFDLNGNFTGAANSALTTLSGSQTKPKVSVRDDGSFLVITLNDDNGDRRLLGVTFTSANVAATNFVTVTAAEASAVGSYGTGSSGGYVVAYSSFGGDGAANGVEVRKFSSDLSDVGTPVVVNTTTTGNQEKPTVAVKTDGSFIVGFEGVGYDGSQSAAMFQAYDTDAVAVGGNIRVNTGTDGVQGSPNIAFNTDGSFVVAFDSASILADNNDFGIVFQRYDANRSPVGGNTVVNTRTFGSQQQPDVSVGAQGTFSIVWQNNQTNEIVARSFNSDGTPLTNELTLATGSLLNQLPAVATLNDYRFGYASGLSANGNDVVFGAQAIALVVNGSTQPDVIQLQTDVSNDIEVIIDGSNEIFPIRFERIIVRGNQGADTITINDELPLPTSIFGGAGPDTIVGSPGRDSIYGGAGGDSISGLAGNDLIFGEDGLDIINGGANNDTIYGGGGADSISGDTGNDFIRGNAGNDTLFGNDGNDRLFGDAGNDLLRGDAGRDTFDGGIGSDTADRRGIETRVSIEVLT